MFTTLELKGETNEHFNLPACCGDHWLGSYQPDARLGRLADQYHRSRAWCLPGWLFPEPNFRCRNDQSGYYHPHHAGYAPGFHNLVGDPKFVPAHHLVNVRKTHLEHYCHQSTRRLAFAEWQLKNKLKEKHYVMGNYRDPVRTVAAWFFWQKVLSNISADWRLDPHASAYHPHPDHFEPGRGDLA